MQWGMKLNSWCEMGGPRHLQHGRNQITFSAKMGNKKKENEGIKLT